MKKLLGNMALGFRTVSLTAAAAVLFAAGGLRAEQGPRSPAPEREYFRQFNQALCEYHRQAFDGARTLWSSLSAETVPLEVRAFAAYDAGNAAFKTARYADAAGHYLETVRRLDSIASPAWPESLSRDERAALFAKLHDDALFNLELARRLLAESEAGAPNEGESPAPEPERKEQSASSPKPAPGRAETRMPRAPSPQTVRKILRDALARDVPPTRPPDSTTPSGAAPDW